MRKAAGPIILFVPAALLLGLFFVVPIGGFMTQGFVGADGSITLDHVRRMWEAGTYMQVMLASVNISLWVAVLSVVVGYPAAFILANADPRSKSTWTVLVLLPFWSSFLVRTFAWIVILGRQGPVNATLTALGLTGQPLELLYGWSAVVIGMTNVLVPFAILTMVGVMERIDRRLVVAAGTLGARPVQAFFRVYLPLSFPGATAAFLLVFISALGFFMAPALLGSARETMITQLVIQQVTELVNWPFAAILCLLLLLTALLLFFLFDRLVGLSTLSGTARQTSGESILGRRIVGALGDMFAGIAEALRLPAPLPGRRGQATTALAVGTILFLIVPLLVLLPVSFSEREFLAWPPGQPGLRWYREVLSSSNWLDAAGRSLLVALSTTALCLVVAVPAAFAFMRLKGGSASAAFAAMIAPLLVPRMVIAVALFYVYARLGLVGTTIGLVIGHTIIALPYVFIAVTAVLKTYDRRFDLAAASLGATPFATVRHVTLPLIAGGVIAASLFAFVISLDELNVALFTSGGLQSTLPKLMWDEATLRFSPLLAAVSTLVLFVMSAVILFAARLRNNP
ncbi:ABC transporter permease subunit [Pseudolabrys sp. FHR47]|uniref:ABC transporter permease subunit n=1 Tax=Pseudolabrys sp. FHR47 TaxID=2562284 RepID=UPI0010BEEF13|nr:ABC transporter permease subunit [Pseudolabrys sp. FHR47]